MDGLSLSARAGDRQEAFWACVDDWTRRAVTALLEAVLLSEQREAIAAGWNERAGGRADWRNGFYRRGLTTPHGRLEVKVPRCRRRRIDCSMLFDRYQRRVADVERILRHAYLLGVSTRGAAQLAEQVFGGAVSHQTVSRLLRWLDGQLAMWRERPIAAGYRVVYIDGMHVDIVGGDRMVMLAAGLRDDGELEVLGFRTSSGEQCLQLLTDLRRRGLEGVELFVSDESGAIRSALEQVYGEVAWQSCSFHRLSALRADIGQTEYRDRMVADAADIFRCPSQRAAVERATAWAKRWKHLSPWAVRQFTTDLGDSLRFYSLPVDLWRRVRTNNPLERLIRTLRQRLRPMGCFHDDHAVERAVFGQLARWHKIKLTHNT